MKEEALISGADFGGHVKKTKAGNLTHCRMQIPVYCIEWQVTLYCQQE